uniref:Uncharacterized protein n=1 Tax=Pipistrellus kuhlii TaxID=59472 RepID=A0A7J7ZK98_PIPKU|nr:hypothetical protein mPipKuh1_009585 [Pipistrellus kuhlii]
MCTPSIISVTLSTPRTHENIELSAAKHGAVHIPTKLWCKAYPHQTLPEPLGVNIPHFGKHCAKGKPLDSIRFSLLPTGGRSYDITGICHKDIPKTLSHQSVRAKVSWSPPLLVLPWVQPSPVPPLKKLPDQPCAACPPCPGSSPARSISPSPNSFNSDFSTSIMSPAHYWGINFTLKCLGGHFSAPQTLQIVAATKCYMKQLAGMVPVFV